MLGLRFPESIPGPSRFFACPFSKGRYAVISNDLQLLFIVALPGILRLPEEERDGHSPDIGGTKYSYLVFPGDQIVVTNGRS